MTTSKDMSTKTKKILAFVCWLAFVIGWQALHTYNIVGSCYVLDRIVDVAITCMGTLLFLWIVNPDLLKKKDKE